MGLRKWNDSEGHVRGARGIDGKKGTYAGQDFVHPYRDKSAEMAMFGRCWPAGAGDFGGAAGQSEKAGGKDTKSWTESEDYDTLSKSGPDFGG